jgi:hypothetical protein
LLEFKLIQIYKGTKYKQDRYEITEKIGVGSFFSIVFAVKDHQDKHQTMFVYAKH